MDNNQYTLFIYEINNFNFNKIYYLYNQNDLIHIKKDKEIAKNLSLKFNILKNKEFHQGNINNFKKFLLYEKKFNNFINQVSYAIENNINIFKYIDEDNDLQFNLEL